MKKTQGMNEIEENINTNEEHTSNAGSKDDENHVENSVKNDVESRVKNYVESRVENTMEHEVKAINKKIEDLTEELNKKFNDMVYAHIDLKKSIDEKRIYIQPRR